MIEYENTLKIIFLEYLKRGDIVFARMRIKDTF
jgi:hypothetical protein